MKIIAKRIKVRGYYRMINLKTSVKVKRKKGGTVSFPATKRVRKWIMPYYKLIDAKAQLNATESK